MQEVYKICEVNSQFCKTIISKYYTFSWSACKNYKFKKFSVTFMNLVKWLCTAVSYLCTRPIDFLGAAKACQPAHLAAHQLPPFCITITTGQAEAIWQSRKKDYECPYFNPSPLRDCWLKCLVFLVLLHTVWTLKEEDISVSNGKKN